MLSGIRLGAVAACWLLIAAVLILEFWPDLPRTHTGWFTFIVVGPPLYVLAEAFGGWLFSERHGKAISPKPFSVLRVLIALVVVLVSVGMIWWISTLIPGT
jgi:hypothetical protein